MPILFVMAGAYVAYKTNVELNRRMLQEGGGSGAIGAAGATSPTDYHLDPTIDRSNKAYIRLLPIEVELCLFELPITTLSFFEGSYETAAIHIQSRMRAILNKNPWLGGWLIRDEMDNYELKLLYDETGQDVCQGYFQVYEPYVIPVGRNNISSYHDAGKKMAAMSATIPMNAQIIGQNNMPLWKVSIIPDVDAPTERFSMAFSMSHILADAHSYYKIFAMLDQDTRIEALQPIRNLSFQQQLAAHAGKDEADFVYLRKVLERQPPPPEPRQWQYQLMQQQPQQQQQLPKNQRQQRNPLAASRRNTDKVVFKMFFIDEDWLLQRKSEQGQRQGQRQGRRSSVYDVQTASTATACVVSANSIITSWFFNVTKPSLGLMAANMRNRLNGIGENDMGNYVHTILYTPVDYKTPALIQESLTHLQRCGSDPISTLPDLWETTNKQQQQQQAEKQQPSDDKTKGEVTPLLTPPAGAKNDDDNINICIGSDTAVDTACAVLELLDCGDTPRVAAATTTTRTTPTPPVPATLTSSISINWARYCPEREIYLVPDLDDSDDDVKDDDGKDDDGKDDDGKDDNNDNNNAAGTGASSSAAAAEKTTTANNDNGIITQTLHIPIFTFQELEVFPDTLSCIAIFTASPRGQHSPERRPGAWLICKESTWLSEIKNCGIVEEMIAEMNL